MIDRRAPAVEAASPIEVLLIEDDLIDEMAVLRTVATEGLPYRVQVARSMAQARAALAGAEFDLILADYALPDGTSFDLLDLFADQLVIFITGAWNEGDAARALRLGVHDYLIKDSNGQYLKLLSYRVQTALRLRDIARRLRESEALLQAILEHAPAAISALDLEGRLILSNRCHGELSALDRSAPPAEAESPSTAEREETFLGPDGMPRTYLSVRFHVPDARGQPQALGSIAVDITARKQAEHLTRQLAFFDPLTGLPNRRLLLDRLRQALATSARRGRHGAVFFVDLDHFKTLNDTLGHDQGDLLLIEVGRRLLACVRSEDTAARLGGDEFVVMAINLAEDPHAAAEQAAQLGRKMLASVSRPFALGGESRCVTPSIGVGLFRELEASPDAVLKRADMAMYQAKAAGRGRLRFFDPEMQAALDARARLQQDLQRALVEGEFGLHFQGQMDLDRGLVSAEALLRWNHPRRGLLTPEHFVPLAEQTGLIGPIGAWVVDAACAQLQAWQSQPEFRHLKLAVNISARKFQQADFTSQVVHALEAHGVAPQRLRLELRECPAPGHTDEAVARMHALKGHGVEFSIEDFGTGESSLAQLRHLPLDQIKIAQRLVSQMKPGPGQSAMVKTIIGAGRELGLSVLAAGVESAEQREVLRLMGCRLWQGYFCGGPMPLEEFERFGRR